MKRIIAVIATVFLAAICAAAQSRRWELLRAEYGAGDSFMDVTSRVRSLVQGETLSMRVDNETLGTDPAPGVRKTLRLRVRDAYGREQEFAYPEKETFSLNLRKGSADSPAGPGYQPGYEGGPPRQPGYGGYGGGLQILRADYGADGRFANVTARLAARIRSDALILRVTNDAMGGDPAEDRTKVLHVWYSYNGRTASVVVNEHDTLNLPSESDFVSGNLRIMRAQYGAGHRYADVTNLLNSRIQGDQLSVRVTNDSMGGDPDPDHPKQLIVFYVFNGRSSRITVNEKNSLNLPGNDAYSSGESGYEGDRLEILNASYGAGDRRRDVTGLLGSLVQGNSLQVVVSNGSMGGDPAEGQRKRLRVIYRWQGFRNQITVGEGETLFIP
jgi:hypothetical protein